MISVLDPLRVHFFSQSLMSSAFGWYTSLSLDSIRTWRQLEDQFHTQYHSEAAEAGIADLAQVKQKTAYEIGVRLVGSEMCIRDSCQRERRSAILSRIQVITT